LQKILIILLTLRKEVRNACKEKEISQEENCKEDNKEEKEKKEVTAGISTDTFNLDVLRGGSNSPHLYYPSLTTF
jgi:hypothetical protein